MGTTKHLRLSRLGPKQPPEVLPIQKAVKVKPHLGPGRVSEHAQRDHTAIPGRPTFLGIFFHKQSHILSVSYPTLDLSWIWLRIWFDLHRKGGKYNQTMSELMSDCLVIREEWQVVIRTCLHEDMPGELITLLQGFSSLTKKLSHFCLLLLPLMRLLCSQTSLLFKWSAGRIGFQPCSLCKSNLKWDSIPLS